VAVDLGAVALDEAAFSSARTRRQQGAADSPTRCGQFGVGQAGVGLQFRQDGDVVFVEISMMVLRF
jgi:hypothetical protein